MTPFQPNPRRALATGLLIAVFHTAALAADESAPRLVLPIDCTPGESCWIVNYVDLDPGPGARDYACGPRTYDGHKGTDIAIRDLGAMEEGVGVRAAAPGTITSLRDWMPDLGKRSAADILEGRDCGNGVVIDHGGGWETQYCHMRLGSIAVERGEAVRAGDRLGAVGLSGRTGYPHLHISLRRNGAVVDPFMGADESSACGLGPTPLWEGETLDALEYRPFDLFSAGFAAEAPELEGIRAGAFRQNRLPASAGALVLWAEVYGVEAGDRLALVITAPDGSVFYAGEQAMPKRQAYRFGYSGRKRPAGGWPPGVYLGRVTLKRAIDGTILSQERTVKVEIR